eukprot:8750043-Heterocapsa_arctica.AAC.1
MGEPGGEPPPGEAVPPDVGPWTWGRLDATRCGAIPAAKAMELVFYFDLVLNFFVSYTDQ